MTLLLIIFSILNVSFYIWLAVGWKKIPEKGGDATSNTFSVIIPMRNEAPHVRRILDHLKNQRFPKERFEIIVVDDFSEDETANEVQSYQAESDLNLRLIQMADAEKQGKKHALTIGVKEAKCPIILTSDADCWFGPEWIEAYDDYFSDKTNMVAGPVAIKGKGIFSKLQQIEFAGLMGFGAVTIAKGKPSMCSGANLGFRKEAFEQVGGYQDNLFTPSGDDEFLLHSIMGTFPGTVSFLKDRRALVSTPAHEKLGNFVNQRVRWTSKWKYNRNPMVRIGAVLFFADYLVFYAALVSTLIGWVSVGLMACSFLVRLLAQWLYLYPISRFLGVKNHAFYMLMIQFIYPLHVIFMGLHSIFGSYTWKGRIYR